MLSAQETVQAIKEKNKKNVVNCFLMSWLYRLLSGSRAVSICINFCHL